MNEVTSLVNLLDSFDFNSADCSSTSSAIDAVLAFLKKAESHLASCITPSPSKSPSKSLPVLDPSLISPKVDYREDFLESTLADDLKKELGKIKCVPMSKKKNTPYIALFGDQPYVFNKVTQSLTPQPITPGSTLYKVLDTVNSKLGVIYNSVLINRYKTKNDTLGWHKDDENVIDQTVPITTLSIGTPRRFQFSESKDDKVRTQMYEKLVRDNSVLVMKPGLQESHFHRIASGRDGQFEEEKGVRFSLTFRRLTTPPNPPPPLTVLSQTSPVITPTETSQTADNHASCPNTIVYGSSLTKDLKCDLLSKRGKTFKVFTRSGARVETVMKMVKDSVNNGEVCTACVESVFVVAGGNDAANIKSDKGLEILKNSYNKLFDLINTQFTSVRVNVLSLIPRGCNNYRHLDNMFTINEFLSQVCSNNTSNLFYIPMFTKYLAYKDLYYSDQQVRLNNRLFKPDKVHFSSIGTCVLAKTLIAVANNPRY